MLSMGTISKMAPLPTYSSSGVPRTKQGDKLELGNKWMRLEVAAMAMCDFHPHLFETPQCLAHSKNKRKWPIPCRFGG